MQAYMRLQLQNRAIKPLGRECKCVVGARVASRSPGSQNLENGVRLNLSQCEKSQCPGYIQSIKTTLPLSTTGKVIPNDVGKRIYTGIAVKSSPWPSPTWRPGRFSLSESMAVGGHVICGQCMHDSAQALLDIHLNIIECAKLDDGIS